jgi:hypothetical protein
MDTIWMWDEKQITTLLCISFFLFLLYVFDFVKDYGRVIDVVLGALPQIMTEICCSQSCEGIVSGSWVWWPLLWSG